MCLRETDYFTRSRVKKFSLFPVLSRKMDTTKAAPIKLAKVGCFRVLWSDFVTPMIFSCFTCKFVQLFDLRGLSSSLSEVIARPDEMCIGRQHARVR
jgi:hypothetical protein